LPFVAQDREAAYSAIPQAMSPPFISKLLWTENPEIAGQLSVALWSQVIVMNYEQKALTALDVQT
jgi:hypothetical protein